MKTRDIFKYALATFIALATIVGIIAMNVSKYQRRVENERQAARLREVFQQNNLGKTLPEKPQATPSPAGAN
ncbi:MAG: hypothetical protein K1X53_09890 [Candidatus Sumerlaeaceae bacterium]|nr:hypothetical protein [Candidatus Sumerlaeaceae bacterium]